MCHEICVMYTQNNRPTEEKISHVSKIESTKLNTAKRKKP